MKKLMVVSLFLLTSLCIGADFQNVSFQLLVGKDIEQVSNFLIKNAVEVFSSYPYLYVVDEELSAHYFQDFLVIKDAAVVILYNDVHEPVGYIRGVPLSESRVGETFINNEIDISRYYYVVDIFIMPEYRGQHLSVKLFEMLLHCSQMELFKIKIMYAEFGLKICK